MPLRRGHILVIPKHHEKRLSELPVNIAEATGAAVSKVARALTLGEMYETSFNYRVTDDLQP